MSSYFYDSAYVNNHYVRSNGTTILGEFLVDQKVSDPTPNNISFGSSQGFIKFIVPVKGDQLFLVDSRAQIDISAITGTGGTYIRGVNALGLYMFDKFALYCNGELAQMITSDQVFTDLLYNIDAERWTSIAKNIGYDTSTSNRNTLAGSAQTFVIPLKWLFGLFAKPLNVNLYKEIEVRFYLKSSIRYCIQTDKTSPTFSYSNFILDSEYCKPYSNQIIDNYEKMLLSNQLVFMDYDYLQKDFNISSGSSSAQLNLSELNDKNVSDIFIIFRPATLVGTNDISDYTDNNVALTSWNIKSGSTYLNGSNFDISFNYFKNVELQRLQFNGIQNVLNRNESVISFVDNYINNSKEDILFFSGSKPFNGIQDALININFSTIGAQYVCSVLCRFAKTTFAVQEGGKAILKSAY